MTLRLIHLAAALAAPLLFLTACGSDENDTATAPTSADTSAAAETTTGSTPSSAADTSAAETSTATEEATITIKDFDFGDPLTVAPGTTVTVVNEDSAPHNANDADGAFSEPLLGQGESATFVAPSEDGTYDLICTAHPQMAGELIVQG